MSDYAPPTDLRRAMERDGYTWDPGNGPGDGRFVKPGGLAITIAGAMEHVQRRVLHDRSDEMRGGSS
jgi:hypothetical protein